jgi:cytochrome c peroxidase
MDNSHEMAVSVIAASAGYRAMFAQAFGSEEVTIDRAAMAVATFEKTTLSGNSPYDRHKRVAEISAAMLEHYKREPPAQ